MNRANIILISIDTLRADHLSCYGYSRQTTPNLDRIAAKGVLFKNAYSTAVWTPPAHASMLTGLYPSQHGVIDENSLSERIPTLAEILSRNGYQTAGFVNNPGVGQLTGLRRGFDTFYELWKGLSGHQIFLRLLHKIKNVLGYTDNWAYKTNELVIDWFNMKKRTEDPFFLFIHYIEPHNPLSAPKPFKGKYLTSELIRRVDGTKLRQAAQNPLICFTDNLELNDAENEALSCLYDEEISYLDQRIGELTNWLNLENLLDDTLLIITADHGEHLGEHGLYSHVASLYEPIVHVPLIVHYPKLNQAAKSIDMLVQLVDVVPTVLHVAGIEVQSFGLPGVSLLPLRFNEEYHESIIAEWEGRIPHFVKERIEKFDKKIDLNRFTNKMTMIRKGSYKYIQSLTGKKELYNIKEDPLESKNMIGENKEISDRFRQMLDDWLINVKNKQEITREQYLLDKVTKKRLQALGYL